MRFINPFLFKPQSDSDFTGNTAVVILACNTEFFWGFCKVCRLVFHNSTPFPQKIRSSRPVKMPLFSDGNTSNDAWSISGAVIGSKRKSVVQITYPSAYCITLFTLFCQDYRQLRVQNQCIPALWNLRKSAGCFCFMYAPSESGSTEGQMPRQTG